MCQQVCSEVSGIIYILATKFAGYKLNRSVKDYVSSPQTLSQEHVAFSFFVDFTSKWLGMGAHVDNKKKILLGIYFFYSLRAFRRPFTATSGEGDSESSVTNFDPTMTPEV